MKIMLHVSTRRDPTYICKNLRFVLAQSGSSYVGILYDIFLRVTTVAKTLRIFVCVLLVTDPVRCT